MIVVVPGLKDRRVASKDFSTDAKKASKYQSSQGVMDERGGILRKQSEDQRQNFQSVADIDTLYLILGDGELSDLSSNKGRDAKAHFVVSAKGDIYYDLDITEQVKAGACASISIEFQSDAAASEYSPLKPSLPGLSRDAIFAGRRLVSYLSSMLPKLKCICRSESLNLMVEEGSIDRDAVQDLWVNIGAWAIAKLYLDGDRRACLPEKEARDSGKRAEEDLWSLNGALLGG